MDIQKIEEIANCIRYESSLIDLLYEGRYNTAWIQHHINILNEWVADLIKELGIDDNPAPGKTEDPNEHQRRAELLEIPESQSDLKKADPEKTVYLLLEYRLDPEHQVVCYDVINVYDTIEAVERQIEKIYQGLPENLQKFCKLQKSPASISGTSYCCEYKAYQLE
jgi:hypothetical protein